MSKITLFDVELCDLQPSQLYICQEKLEAVELALKQSPDTQLKPVPVRRLGSWLILTDGHTRALAAHRQGHRSIQAIWETDDLDWTAYEICVGWCRDEGILTVTDLHSRIISAGDYDKLWIDRCRIMHKRLAEQRKLDSKNISKR